MSLLTMIQNVCKRVGIATPSTVYANTDAAIVRMLALANTEGRDLSRRHEWQALLKEATFLATATATQGAIVSIVATGDFDYIINDTIWNRSQYRSTPGPISAQSWQMLQGTAVSGPYSNFRIRGNKVLLYPAPTSGDTLAFEYKSTFWAETTAGSGLADWAADSNTGLLSESLMEDGIVWRWKHSIGMDYGEDFAHYERRVADAIARDGGARTFNLAGDNQVKPGIFIPEGSWNL